MSDELKDVEDQMNQAKMRLMREAARTKESEQRKHDMVVYLAHDLKTPLTSIIGYLTLICEERGISDEWREKYLSMNYSFPGTAIEISLQIINGQIEIEVQNHGNTIPEEQLERIFEQFFRIDTARRSSTGGSGIGLAIAKEIIELHGGTISAESGNNIIKFHIILPSNP